MAPSDLTPEERRTLEGLKSALEQFTLLKPTIPVHHVVMFLRLALDEGKSNKHYAEQHKVSPSVASMALLGLGKKAANGEPGLQLIEDRPSLHSLKERQLYLNTKGKALLSRILKRITP